MRAVINYIVLNVVLTGMKGLVRKKQQESL